MKYLLPFLLISFLFVGCQTKEKRPSNSAFGPESSTTSGSDFDRLLEGGELIVGTFSSPETYYEYRGMRLGLQYTMASDFAGNAGVQLQVDEAADTAQLAKKLNDGDIDIICVQLPDAYISRQGWTACGAQNAKAHTSWAVKKDAKGLAEALNKWFNPSQEAKARNKEKKNFAERNFVRRHVYAPFLSREKGIISPYDAHFKKASAKTGWDWRLIAAQSYQESGFDPQAVSWAGAKGLMQIMPGTAGQMGLSPDRLTDPAANVETAARYIRMLDDRFRDIRDRSERAKFVLASYNGGYAHIRDAMALAQKHGKNPLLWDDVSFYVLRLSQPAFYRDPVVKHGYMIGSETYGYVSSILQRYRQYGGTNLSTGVVGGSLHSAPERATKKNRFSHPIKILGPDEI